MDSASIKIPAIITAENFPGDFPKIKFDTVDELTKAVSWALTVQDLMSLEVVTSNTWRAIRTAVLLNIQPADQESLRKMEFALEVLRDFMFAHPFFASIHPQWSFNVEPPEMISETDSCYESDVELDEGVDPSTVH